MMVRLSCLSLCAASILSAPIVELCLAEEGPPLRRARIVRKYHEAKDEHGRAAVHRHIRKEVVSRANGEGGEGPVWKREFDEASPVPVVIQRNHGLFSAENSPLGVLRSMSDLPLYDQETRCEVQVEVVEAPTGFDLRYTIANHTDSVQPLPMIQVPGHELGLVIQFLDHRFGCDFITLDVSGGNNAFTAHSSYPHTLYAPVIVAKDDRFAMGMSLQYDVMGWRHPIRTAVSRARSGTRYGDNWTGRFFLDGELAPQEEREYVINVRYTEPDEWIHTLEPYRDFFRSRYGEVRYAQDMRPVWGQQLGDSRLVSPENPRGFKGFRADLNGFKRDVDRTLEFAVPAGYERLMIWTPAGCYLENRQHNFPPHIMTHWTDPMRTSASEWRRIPEAGIELMFWWGRAAQYAYDWDPSTLEDFNPRNRRQADEMLREWVLAQERGAMGLGLDKFPVMGAWDAVPWVMTLQALRPGSVFVSEPASYDILHRHIPTFVQAEHLPTPHLLADYLVPGREMWVHLVGEHATLETALKYIDWGMTVTTKTRAFTAHDLREAILAAQGE